MIRDSAKIIVTQTGVSLKEALTEEVVKALNEEASNYMNYGIPEIKLVGNPPSGKASRRARKYPCSIKNRSDHKNVIFKEVKK